MGRGSAPLAVLRGATILTQLAGPGGWVVWSPNQAAVNGSWDPGILDELKLLSWSLVAGV